MNSRESVLVYAVTAILAVLVAGAVLFGGDGDGAAARESEADRSAASPDDLLDDLDLDDPGGGGDGGGSDSTENDDDSEETQPAADPGESVDDEVRLRRLLGHFEIERGGGGQKYRRVTVRRGDTLLGLVLRWTGSRELLPDVKALNEWIEGERIDAGDELLLPWVANGILLERARREGDGLVNAPLRRPAGPSADERSAESAADGPSRPVREAEPRRAPGGAVHTVQEGEALWSIAADRVGAAQADAYVREIVEANDSIADSSRIQVGQKIILP